SPFRVDIELTDPTNLTVALPVYMDDAATRFTVHWGDGEVAEEGDLEPYVHCADNCLLGGPGGVAEGTSSNGTTATAKIQKNHTYASTGTYSVVIRGAITRWKDLMEISADYDPANAS
ncbi:unnamed protein product, partial [Amoebophrya sp. A120]